MPVKIKFTEMEERLQALGKNVFAREGSLPVIERDSDQWTAWRRWRVEHGMSVNFMDTRERWTVPLEWPPSDLEAAEIEHSKTKSRLDDKFNPPEAKA